MHTLLQLDQLASNNSARDPEGLVVNNGSGHVVRLTKVQWG